MFTDISRDRHSAGEEHQNDFNRCIGPGQNRDCGKALTDPL